jgi:hypothetical protein
LSHRIAPFMLLPDEIRDLFLYRAHETCHAAHANLLTAD